VKTALVTGATGFVGGHLVRAALARGYLVRALVLPDDPGEAALRARGVEIVTGDVRDLEPVRRAVGGSEVVFHCAALVSDWAPRRLFFEVTVGGTANVCLAAAEARVSRLVYISTNDVFGLDESRVLDERSPRKRWHEPYPDAKIAAERVAWRFRFERGLPVTMVYPCWVYGEGDRVFLPALAEAILRRDLVFWRNGALVWPTYVENLADLLLLIAEDARAVGQGYIVHDGEPATLEELCAAIATALGVPPVRVHIPYGAAFAAALILESVWTLLRRKKRPLLTTYAVKNLGSRLRFSIEKAARELGWRPKVPFKTGLARTLEWLRTLDLERRDR